MSVEEGVLVWPRMARFGADLKLVFNESLGRKFLKFVIDDQAQFERMGGGNGEALIRRFREAGFVYCPNETARNAAQAYDLAMSRGLGVAEAEQAVAQARKTLFFYSSSTRLSHARLSAVVPALVARGDDNDYPKQPVSAFREMDAQFLSPSFLDGFIQSQQQFRGAQPGRWYSGPAERAMMAAARALPLSVNEALGYRDLPPRSGTRVPHELAWLEKFSSARLVEAAVQRQTLDLTGTPLRSPQFDAMFLGYATREAAIAGNGGVDEGIESLGLPFGIPLGFDADSGRLMVLKDARFLEYSEQDLPAIEDLYSVEKHIDFMRAIHAIRKEYEALVQDGLMTAETWAEPEAASRALARCDTVFERMKSALAPWGSTQGFVSEDDIRCFGSQRAGYFTRPENQEFVRFLTVFRTQMYNAVRQCSGKKAAHAAYAASMARLQLPLGGTTPRAGDGGVQRLISAVLGASLTGAGPARASAAHLRVFERQGEDRRAGIDVDAQAFRDVFQVRAVETGIWLPEAGRQRVMNEAFDALMDQAMVLGQPPEVIGLGGTLTLAFGCRGEAEHGAREAHYEPGRVILHLPAMEGAGTISRAWALAFDAWLARVVSGGTYTSLVEQCASEPVGVRQHPLVEDMAWIMGRMKSVPLTPDESARPWTQIVTGDEFVPMSRVMQTRLIDWIGTIDRQLPDADQQGDFYQHALARLRSEWVVSPGMERFYVQQLADVQGFVSDICLAMDAACGSDAWRDAVNLDLPAELDQVCRSREARAREVIATWEPGRYRRDTEYFASASHHDMVEGRVRWAVDGALFARVFEAWTEATLANDHGCVSPYLVVGTTLGMGADHPVYPTGIDRGVLFGMLGSFFQSNARELRALGNGCAVVPEAVKRLMPRSDPPVFTL